MRSAPLGRRSGAWLTRLAVLLVWGAIGCSSGPSATSSSTSNPMPIGMEATTSIVLTPSSVPSQSPSPTTVPSTRASTLPESDLARVLLVGDSSLAGVRWYGGAAERLRGARFVLDAESCRRVAVPSCGGREDRISSNVVERILASGPNEFDVLIVMSGYNDDGRGFNDAIGAVYGTANSLGFDHVVFLTLTDPTPGLLAIETVTQNEALRAFAPPPNPDAASWLLADWHAYAAPFMGDWYEADHVHLSPRGSYAVADYVSRIAAHILGRSCPGSDDPVCPIPTAPTSDAVVDFEQAPHVRCLEIGNGDELVCESVD